MKIKINEHRIIGLFFFLLTFSGSLFCNEYGLTKMLEYLSYGILFYISFKHTKLNNIRIKIFPIVILALFVVGILLQNLSLMRRITLCFTMIALWISVFKSDNLLCKVNILRLVSQSIVIAIIISFILCVLTNLPITDAVYDSNALIKLGFNGGIKHKNYFAADLLAVFAGYYFSYKYNFGKKKHNIIAMVVIVIAIVASGSRGAYFILISFLITANIDKLEYIKKTQRRILGVVLVSLGVLGFIFAFKNIAMNSSTYMYRLRGFTNYLSYYSQDTFHLIFGNAESFFDQELEYVYAVRSVVGWDGTLEFSWVNVLIKNGFLGMLAFILIFIYYIKRILNSKHVRIRNIVFPVLIMLIVSSFVETYMQTIHNLFGIYCYMTISGFLSNRKGLIV